MTINYKAACWREGPYRRKAPTEKYPNRTLPVRCNRPCGHSGLHMYSELNKARVFEWDDRWDRKEVG